MKLFKAPVFAKGFYWAGCSAYGSLVVSLTCAAVHRAAGCWWDLGDWVGQGAARPNYFHKGRRPARPPNRPASKRDPINAATPYTALRMLKS